MAKNFGEKFGRGFGQTFAPTAQQSFMMKLQQLMNEPDVQQQRKLRDLQIQEAERKASMAPDANALQRRLTESQIAENLASANRKSDPVSASLLYQMQKDNDKKTVDIQELQIPGYQLKGDVRPTQKEAQDLRTGVAATQDFISGVDRLKELIKKYGSTNLYGAGSGEVETLAANLKLTLKEVQKLGVLSATDVAFLESQVFDPSKLKSWLTSTKTALSQLDTIQNRAKSGLQSSLTTKGYSAAKQEKQGQATSEAPTATNAKGEKVMWNGKAWVPTK